MIKLFDCGDTVFNTSNGDRIIEASKCNVTKGDIAKGEYYVDLETSVKYSDILVQDKIIVVPTPIGEQPFRLNNPQKKSDKLIFKANHIFYDTKGYVIEDAYPQNMGCQSALNWIFGKTDVENSFKAYSDLIDSRNVRYVNKSLFDVICMMADEWGGQLDVDGLTVKILSSVGEDRGVTIRYGKNLTNITAKEDWNNVCTKLYAVGYEGVSLDAPLVSNLKYGRPYSKTVEFQPSIDVDLSNTNEIKADLKKQAEVYMKENEYPKVTYTIKSHIDNVVEIGDPIQVIHEVLNIDILTEVVCYTYNSITGRFLQMTIGNYFQDLKGVFSNISQKVDQIENVVSKSYKALRMGLEESKTLINQYLTYGYRYSTESAEYYLNKKDPEEATQFMVISLGGIGFGTKNAGSSIIEATYDTAWTLDGKFNGSFITANSIKAIALDIEDLFSQNIKATGSITGATLVSIKDEYAKIVIDKGVITIFGFDTRGDGGFYEIGSLYNAGHAVGASGNWIFDDIETTSGANLDTINSNLNTVKTVLNENSVLVKQCGKKVEVSIYNATARTLKANQWNTLVTIPTGSRPSYNVRFSADDNTASKHANNTVIAGRVLTDGQVQLWAFDDKTSLAPCGSCSFFT